MWRNTPVNQPRVRGGGGGGGSVRRRGSGPTFPASLTSSSPLPRLGPVLPKPSGPSFGSSNSSAKGATPQVHDGHTRTSAVMSGPPGRSVRSSAASTTHVSVGRLPSTLHGSPFNTSSSSGGGLHTSGGRWQLQESHRPLPPQHLAALAVRRPVATKMPWRRGKPITRQLTTTVSATVATPTVAQPTSPPPPPQQGGLPLSSGRFSEVEFGAPSAVAVPLPPIPPSTLLSMPSQMYMAEEGPAHSVAAAAAVVAASPSSIQGSPLCEVPYTAAVSNSLFATGSAEGAASVPTSLAAGAAVDGAVSGIERTSLITPAPTTTPTPTPSSSFPLLPLAAGTQQSDYAQVHQLPRLFAEMVSDLAIAQPCVGSASEAGDDGSGLENVEQWIQHWFRTRYDRSHAPNVSAASPFAKRVRDAVVRVGLDNRRLIGLPPATPPVTAAADSKASSSVSSSVNRRFVPLTAAAAATSSSSSIASPNAFGGEGVVFCASLNSGEGVAAPLSNTVPLRVSSSPSSTSSQRPSAVSPVVMVVVPPPRGGPHAKSPLTSAGTAGAERPPRPVSHQVAVSSGTKINKSSAASTGERRLLTTLTCAVEGMRSSVSEPEAASAHE